MVHRIARGAVACGREAHALCGAQADDVSTGLPSILPETLAAAVRGQGSLAGTRLLLLDCRYPYEHSGGCIRGALNVQVRGRLGLLGYRVQRTLLHLPP